MSESQTNLEAFSDFEKSSHDKLAESYHDAFSAVTNRAIEPILQAVHVETGLGCSTLQLDPERWLPRQRNAALE